MTSKSLSTLLVAASLSLAPAVHAAATITIVNGDPAGVGFNDATVVAPVGGNPGTTRGQQRLNAFQAAADIWGATLTAAPTIRVLATWEALTCTATGAVLGSAGATEIFRDFTGAPLSGHWYGKALTAKIFGADPDPATADIRARFNINLGNSGCLTGIFFYLGLDGNHGANVDLVTVLAHEFAHGLGFQTFTNGSTGVYQSGFPSAWDDYLLDTKTNLAWSAMTNAQRAASAINTGRLVWSGPIVAAGVPIALQQGAPTLKITAPASLAANYLVGTSSTFGAPLNTTGVSGEVMPAITNVPPAPSLPGDACGPITGANAAAISGKIAYMDRGTCGFAVKAKNAQDAGAIGVIIGNNAVGSPPPGMGGVDATVTIPAVQISQSDATALKAALALRSRTHSGIFASLKIDLTVYSGADSAARAWMYAPNPFASGSSVSHFDISAFPNQLMEPSINGDLTHNVILPFDLTFALLKDIGWN